MSCSVVNIQHDDFIKWKHFRVIGHLCGEFTGPWWIPHTQRPVTRSFDVFFDLRLNKRLSKRSWGWWFETLSYSLWCQCNGALVTSHGHFFRKTHKRHPIAHRRRRVMGVSRELKVRTIICFSLMFFFIEIALYSTVIYRYSIYDLVVHVISLHIFTRIASLSLEQSFLPVSVNQPRSLYRNATKHTKSRTVCNLSTAIHWWNLISCHDNTIP